MRRGIRILALVLALMLLMTMAAAAENIEYDKTKNNNAVEKSGVQVAPVASGCTVAFAENSEKLKVTYENANLKKGDMVIVLFLATMDANNKSVKVETVEAAQASITPTDGNIQYINQIDVTEETAGRIEFDVYPQSYSNGVIRVIWQNSDVHTETVAAVNRDYILGDANRDGTVDLMDVSAVLMYAVYTEKEEYQNIDLLASDVNGDGTIDIMDVSAILMYAVKDVPFKQSN